MAPFRAVALTAFYTALVTASPHSSNILPRKPPSDSIVNQTTCNGQTYTYQQLAGYGFVASNARDKYGDTLGGYGSAIALDKKEWKKTGDGKYAGVLYAIPDRGWQVEE